MPRAAAVRFPERFVLLLRAYMKASDMAADPNPFAHGNTWLRADFHLHTKADKEFSYAGEENSFVAAYVDRLKQANIEVLRTDRMGAITVRTDGRRVEVETVMGF